MVDGGRSFDYGDISYIAQVVDFSEWRICDLRPKWGRILSSESVAKMRCRQIGSEDLAAVAGLLSQGFPRRSTAEWAGALQSLKSHRPPEGYEKFGYMVETEGAPVGAILVLSSKPSGILAPVRCNVSSWYIKPQFRSYGTILSSRASRHSSAVYINIDPARATWPIIEAQGFKRYAEGVYASVPMLSIGSDHAKVLPYKLIETCHLGAEDQQILSDHHHYGCISLCVRAKGHEYPFVFTKRRFRFPLPCVDLVYCRDLEDYVRFARPLGFFLAAKGIFWTIMSSSSRVTGLPGIYLPNKLPLYFKGSAAPRLGDLTYTEIAMFDWIW